VVIRLTGGWGWGSFINGLPIQPIELGFMKIKISCLVLAVAGVAGLIPSPVCGQPQPVPSGTLEINTNTETGLPVIAIGGATTPPVILASNMPAGGAGSNMPPVVTNKPVVVRKEPKVEENKPWPVKIEPVVMTKEPVVVTNKPAAVTKAPTVEKNEPVPVKIMPVTKGPEVMTNEQVMVKGPPAVVTNASPVVMDVPVTNRPAVFPGTNPPLIMLETNSDGSRIFPRVTPMRKKPWWRLGIF
jgi:hypothetical protein